VADQRSTRTYSSKIIKASALIPDTKTLLATWDLSLSVDENLQRARRENIFGKASRSRVEDILAIFRQRYLTNGSVLRALVALTHSILPSEALDRILYFHAAQADALLHDTVTDMIWPMYEEGYRDLLIEDVQRTVGEWAAQGKTTSPWGDATVRRVAQGLVATLRDFGVLEGKANKRITSPYLPVEAFAYIAFALAQQEPSGERLLEHKSWRLYFLRPHKVERLFMEAHQCHLLHFQAAGSVIRLEFPADFLEAYAHAIAHGTS